MGKYVEIEQHALEKLVDQRRNPKRNFKKILGQMKMEAQYTKTYEM
jgi:uncharacterized protein YjbK